VRLYYLARPCSVAQPLRTARVVADLGLDVGARHVGDSAATFHAYIGQNGGAMVHHSYVRHAVARLHDLRGGTSTAARAALQPGARCRTLWR